MERIENIIRKINDGKNKVVKMVSNPNNENQLRIYYDDCLFMGWMNLEEVSQEEKEKIMEEIDDEILKISISDEEWENEKHWTTSRMELHYLNQEEGIEKWWNEESQNYQQKIMKQIEGII